MRNVQLGFSQKLSIALANLFFALLILIIASCNNNGFEGTPAQSYPAKEVEMEGTVVIDEDYETDEADANVETSPPSNVTDDTMAEDSSKKTAEDSSKKASEDCIQNDKINFAFSPEIKKCLDEGRLYDFNRSKCTNIKDSTFKCTFKDSIAKIHSMGMSMPELEKVQSNPNAKLVSCGEKDKGNTLLLEWVILPDGLKTCDFSESNAVVYLACFERKFIVTAPAVTEEDQIRAMNACIDR